MRKMLPTTPRLLREGFLCRAPNPCIICPGSAGEPTTSPQCVGGEGAQATDL